MRVQRTLFNRLDFCNLKKQHILHSDQLADDLKAFPSEMCWKRNGAGFSRFNCGGAAFDYQWES